MHWQYKLSFYYICPWCHTTSEELVYSFAMRYSFVKDSKCKTHEYLLRYVQLTSCVLIS